MNSIAISLATILLIVIASMPSEKFDDIQYATSKKSKKQKNDTAIAIFSKSDIVTRDCIDDKEDNDER